MSEWYWRVIALKAAFVITCLTTYLNADDAFQKLPFCNPDNAKQDASNHNDLVLVSTLDGKLTAFSTNNGIKAWDIKTQPLLQSNLHYFELSSGGKWVRLVPSLRGTLYTLSGDTVEPLPFNTDQLLSASFKYAEDLVVAGSREKQWMGVDANTGAIVYECSSQGCSGDKEGYGRTVIALSRHSNTVRALDPMSGDEKWNYSVAEINLGLSNSPQCDHPPPSGDDLTYTVQVAPEGAVAVCKGDSKMTLWNHKLEAPVAGMWRLRAGVLETIDVLWAATKALSSETYIQTTPPSLYIGLHNQQLYIQESDAYIAKADTMVAAKPLPWKLKGARPLLNGPETTTALQNADPNTLSLITLYGSTGQGNHGFFLYQEETCEQSIQITDDLDAPEIIQNEKRDTIEHHHVHVHVYSLWFWWKEVLLIVISSTLLMNLMIWPRFFAPKFRVSTPLPMNKEYIVVEKHYDRPAPSQEYCGRYETDFTPLRCLGRGGFGVVFEARNNIDHCSYAVKRITLPRRASRRERVLREVRALAKLEHEHIVRYFNAWLEEPPPRWQEDRDQHWLRELDGVSLVMTDDYTSPKSSHHATSDKSHIKSNKSRDKQGSVMLNLQGRDLDYEGQLSEPSKRHRSRSCNDSFSIVFDDNPSKDENVPSKSTLKSSLDQTGHLKLPHNLTLNKNLASGDNDDSFIVFENSEDVNHNSKGLSEARNVSYNKQLERVKEGEVTKNDASAHSRKKKKGHTRHWSLDLCVREEPPSKMYLYIQMQLCLRDSLHDWLRQHPTRQDRGDKVVTLFSQIVSAVDYVHLAGLIHRDLKPSNIFFAPDGRVKVGDFGLVTTMNDNSQDGEEAPSNLNFKATRHTYKVGTHLYMSPEQLRGAAYSYKVDIYSLGLVLFELLQPFSTEAERVASLLALRGGKYPSNFHLHYPKEMEVLNLMLSSDPSLRPTASGVRARAPLYQDTDCTWHFTLPNMGA